MGNCMNNVGSDAEKLAQAQRMDSDDDDIKYPNINQGSKMHNKEIEKHMREQYKRDNEIIKILLLGAGSSGKSTLFRQIECIHGEDNYGNAMGQQDDRDVARYFATMPSMKRTIRYNCAGALVKLLQKSDLLSKEPYNIQECVIDFNNEEIENAIKMVVHFSKNANHEMKCDDPEELAQLAVAMNLLWNLDGVKCTFKHRQFFSLMENIDYFLNKISIIMDESEDNRYEPTIEDILNARMQTTGIIERAFIIQKIKFEIFDVGGQRNERRKWIGLFDKVNGLIFVAALNHYCCVLFEDETVNAMQESLQLFDEIVNAKWFTSKHTQFILFLNKDDLFRIRLRDDRIPLGFCFGDDYQGRNYTDKSDEELAKMDEGELEEHFNECYDDAIKFIKQQYLERNRNKRVTSIFMHVTTATEKSNIQKVFDDVRMGIISQSLATSGFHVDMQNLIQE